METIKDGLEFVGECIVWLSPIIMVYLLGAFFEGNLLWLNTFTKRVVFLGVSALAYAWLGGYFEKKP